MLNKVACHCMNGQGHRIGWWCAAFLLGASLALPACNRTDPQRSAAEAASKGGPLLKGFQIFEDLDSLEVAIDEEIKVLDQQDYRSFVTQHVSLREFKKLLAQDGKDLDQFLLELKDPRSKLDENFERVLSALRECRRKSRTIRVGGDSAECDGHIWVRRDGRWYLLLK